jgi:beta-carotene hydroxylase
VLSLPSQLRLSDQPLLTFVTDKAASQSLKNDNRVSLIALLTVAYCTPDSGIKVVIMSTKVGLVFFKMISNEQEAQQVVIRHIGGFAWPTAVLFAFCALVFLACVRNLLIDPVFSMWTLAGISFCAYAMYTPLHDAVHGAVTGMSLERRWMNEWVGYVSGHVLGVSFVAHRRSHLLHHRATNHPTDDPDGTFAASNLPQLVAMWLKGIPKEWVFALKFEHFTVAERRAVRLEYLAIMTTRGLLLLLCADLGVTVMTLLLGQMLGNSVLTTLFAWSVHHPHSEQARMQTTTVYQARAGLDTLMTWLWVYQNYHAIHHLYPKVPFFRYRSLYRALEPYLLASGVPVKRLL